MQIRLIRSQFLDASYSIHILSDKLSGKRLLQMDYKTVTLYRARATGND